MMQFSITFNDPNPDFIIIVIIVVIINHYHHHYHHLLVIVKRGKGPPLFDVEYLRNSTRKRHSNNGILIKKLHMAFRGDQSEGGP